MQRCDIFEGQYHMPVRFIAALLSCCLLFSTTLIAQSQRGCTVLGQTPATAFPLCTKDTFVQTTVPFCTNSTVSVPGCNAANASYEDKNPYWYRFTCYQTGTLGFSITPNDLQDDYDWQLYDITGISDLSNVYNNTALFVVANWSGSSGVTGASNAGAHAVECGSDPAENINTFSSMPVLQDGHTYLLLVSHFSNNQSGYKLSFGGGTAVINDPKLPDLQQLQSSCDASTITIKLTTKMKCTSLAADGSDFTITPAAATVVSASGAGCNSSFDMDSVILVLSNPLPPGQYMISIRQGKDVNTLLDDCDREIPAGHQLPLKITALQPTPLDSISPVKCAPSQLELVFSKNIRCNTIAANGSDFIVTGPAPVTITSASTNCNNNLGNRIVLQLAAPVVVGGTYQVRLQAGTDFNTIIDECGQQTPQNGSVSFTVKDTVSAAFNYQLKLGCKADSVLFTHDGSHGVNQWQWIFDASGASTAQSKTVVFTNFSAKNISLAVSNGFCTDTLQKVITLGNELKAVINASSPLCPEDAASFTSNSIGATASYWNFGNGITSQQPNPAPQRYPKLGAEKDYPVQLIVQNSLPCYDTAVFALKVLKTCYIAVPNAFTPNKDQTNDYLYPLNAYKADNLEFNVYNRMGQLVFHTTDWTKKWDGSINGKPQSAGTYVWTLRYTDRDSGKKVFLKGSSVLIR